MTDDAVHHPKHYTSDPSGVECITITRHRNFNIGNAIKYLWRCGLKQPDGAAVPTTQDMNKAIWYILDEIRRLGGTTEFIATRDAKEFAKDQRNGQIMEYATAINRVREKAIQVEMVLADLFGGHPDQLQVSSLDHLSVVIPAAKAKALFAALGGPWQAVLDRIEEKTADKAKAKDAGEDPRLKDEKKG